MPSRQTATCRSPTPQPPPDNAIPGSLNNADRVLFGITKANAVSNVYATSLATVDNTADKMTAAQLTLAKRLARTANPKIRPIRINNDEEWYVVFVPSLVFRDLMLDPVIINCLQYAWNRGQDNPLFTAGDILYDGLIIREIPELPYVASTIQCGASLPVRRTGHRHRLGTADEGHHQRTRLRVYVGRWRAGNPRRAEAAVRHRSHRRHN